MVEEEMEEVEEGFVRAIPVRGGRRERAAQKLDFCIASVSKVSDSTSKVSMPQVVHRGVRDRLIILRTPTILLAASDSGMSPILTRLLFSAHLRATQHSFTHVRASSSVLACVDSTTRTANLHELGQLKESPLPCHRPTRTLTPTHRS